MDKLTEAIDRYNAHLATCIIANGPDHYKVCRHGRDLDTAIYNAQVEANESK